MINTRVEMVGATFAARPAEGLAQCKLMSLDRGCMRRPPTERDIIANVGCLQDGTTQRVLHILPWHR